MAIEKSIGESVRFDKIRHQITTKFIKLCCRKLIKLEEKTEFAEIDRVLIFFFQQANKLWWNYNWFVNENSIQFG